MIRHTPTPWWALLVIVDKAVNWTLGWILGGGWQPWGWTISDRLWLLKTQGRRVGQIGCRLLDIADADHCDESIGNEDE